MLRSKLYFQLIEKLLIEQLFLCLFNSKCLSERCLACVKQDGESGYRRLLFNLSFTKLNNLGFTVSSVCTLMPKRLMPENELAYFVLRLLIQFFTICFYGAVSESFALTAMYFSLVAKEKYTKERPPCIFLDPVLRIHKGIEVNTALKQTSTLIPCSFALLGEDDGIEKRSLSIESVKGFCPIICQLRGKIFRLRRRHFSLTSKE